jgi:hypothetical protein
VNLAQVMLAAFLAGTPPTQPVIPPDVPRSARTARRFERRKDGLVLGVQHGKLAFVDRPKLAGRGKGMR